MMKYRYYLKDHAIWIFLFGWLLFSTETFLLTVGGATWLMVFTAVSLIVCFFIGTFVEYREKKKYIEDILKLSEQLNKKYLVVEMITAGKKQDEKMLYEVMRSMEKSMNEQVASKSRTTREYKEYIEMWIHEVKVPIAASRMILCNHKDMEYGYGEQLDRLENYVEQALFYARSSDVEKDYLIRPTDLHSIVEQVLIQKKTELIAKRASVQLEDFSEMVYSDGKWMEFIIGQVIDNSIKYAKDSGLTLTISMQSGEEKTIFNICDNGIGVKAEETERVFDKSFTGANGRKFKKSTGIGLYLCKKLCERLGNQILFSSKEGIGSTVTFVFPKSSLIEEVR